MVAIAVELHGFLHFASDGGGEVQIDLRLLHVALQPTSVETREREGLPPLIAGEPTETGLGVEFD